MLLLSAIHPLSHLELVVDAHEDLVVRVEPAVVLAVVQLRVLLAAADLLLALDRAGERGDVGRPG